jgi:hypothetical protein
VQFRWRYAKLVNGSVGGITRGCVVGVSMVAGVLRVLGLCCEGGRLAARPLFYVNIFFIFFFFFFFFLVNLCLLSAKCV